MSSNVNLLKDPKTVAVIGCQFRGGQGKMGVEQGPVHLVNAGLLGQIKELGWNVRWDGYQSYEHLEEKITVETDPNIGRMRRPRLVSNVCEEVSKTVEQHAKEGQFVLTLGGDHSLGMATIGGTLEVYPELCVVWVDAHADINTPETTDLGWLHGMPVSFLLGISNVPEYSWTKGKLHPSRIAYIGLRDIEAGEKATLKKLGIKTFSMHHVDKYGIGGVVKMALDAINPTRERPIHLSFDIDSLDPQFAPSTGTPVWGGLTFREGRYICEAVCETGKLIAMDLVEVNPCLTDPASAKRTVAAGCALVRAALGEELL
ncbi:hypothetical protein BDQ12DRAFT_691548 [Crucibulum laeve]|uniref:Arginase n=1 Tax=Crucibulum laeve TaxID=68775 RepID=A0A5C3LJ45_9AGAR|nr:hypothetical protein BDQ12DRAFT_691548 [Crucibulum laeve]